MASIEGLLVEDGWVMGGVSTNVVGSECTFPVERVEDWLELSEEEAQEALMDAAFGSGRFEIYLKG